MPKAKSSKPAQSPAKEPARPQLWFVFQDGAQVYGVSPAMVAEVAGHSVMAPVPLSPVWLDGVVCIRGVVLPVLNLASFFGLEPKSHGSRLVLLGPQAERFAVWSDKVHGLVQVQQDQLEAPLSTLPDALRRCCEGQFRMGNRDVLVLNAPRLLDQSREPASPQET